MIARMIAIACAGACISQPSRPECSAPRELTELRMNPPLYSPWLSNDRRNLFLAAHSPTLGGTAIWRAHRDDPAGSFAPAQFFIDSDSDFDAFDPALSPDGGTLWYVDGSGDSGGVLHEVKLTGTQGNGDIVSNTLIATDRRLLHATFTDPPTTMYYSRYVGEYDLYMATRATPTATDFDPEIPLDELNTSDNESGATISLDGKTLYFQSSGLGADGRDNIMAATHSGNLFVNPAPIAKVQHAYGFDDNMGSVHPDGTTIVFASGRDGDNTRPTIWIACE